MEAIMDLYDIPTPTRISPWIGNLLPKMPDNSPDYVDPYPIEECELTESEEKYYKRKRKYENKNRNIKRAKARIATKKYSRSKFDILFRFDTGEEKQFESIDHCIIETGLSQDTIRKMCRTGYVLDGCSASYESKSGTIMGYESSVILTTPEGEEVFYKCQADCLREIGKTDGAIQRWLRGAVSKEGYRARRATEKDIKRYAL